MIEVRMSYFEYTRVDYKNLLLAFTWIFDNERCPLPDKLICRGILKTVNDALVTDWEGVHEDSELKGLINEEVHFYILDVLNNYICLLQKLRDGKGARKVWPNDLQFYEVNFNALFRDLIIKKPVN